MQYCNIKVCADKKKVVILPMNYKKNKMMDYTKISEVLIYKRKNDINDFGISNQGTLEHEFYTRLVARPFLYENVENLYADSLIPHIFNNAAYIVTLICLAEHPVQYLRPYYEITSHNFGSPLWSYHMFPATMALVYNWLNHIDALSANPESAILKKKIYDKFADWDKKGLAGGKRDFYGLIIIPSPQISNFCAIDFKPRELSDICNDAIADSTIAGGLGYLISRSKIEGKELLLIERVKPIIHRLTNGGTTYNSYADVLQQGVEYLERISEEKDTKEEEASTSTAAEQRIKELEQLNKKLMSEIRQLQAHKDHHEDLQQAQPTIEQQKEEIQQLQLTIEEKEQEIAHLSAALDEKLEGMEKGASGYSNKVRMAFVLKMMTINGADLEKRGNKARAAEVLQAITGITHKVCENYCSQLDLNRESHKTDIKELNTKLETLGMKMRL